MQRRAVDVGRRADVDHHRLAHGTDVRPRAPALRVSDTAEPAVEDCRRDSLVRYAEWLHKYFLAACALPVDPIRWDPRGAMRRQ